MPTSITDEAVMDNPNVSLMDVVYNINNCRNVICREAIQNKMLCPPEYAYKIMELFHYTGTTLPGIYELHAEDISDGRLTDLLTRFVINACENNSSSLFERLEELILEDEKLQFRISVINAYGAHPIPSNQNLNQDDVRIIIHACSISGSN
jgi:hypothetical protein